MLSLLYSKIDSNQPLGTYLFSRFHAILATENWSFSDPDPKLAITNPDPDPAKNYGSDRIRIYNTVSRSLR